MVTCNRMAADCVEQHQRGGNLPVPHHLTHYCGFFNFPDTDCSKRAIKLQQYVIKTKEKSMFVSNRVFLNW